MSSSITSDKVSFDGRSEVGQLEEGHVRGLADDVGVLEGGGNAQAGNEEESDEEDECSDDERGGKAQDDEKERWWHPPSLEAAMITHAKIKRVLFPPQKTGPGYHNPDLDTVLATHL
ncbi:hypothetical protein P691DRAFT_765687 [Macrolepiota fuliginosa MF-IS2]|uniref:Uncharacterized protein n=1 Tax=Macrolepiota fuliginosa MF-IS2 TaxID=1400762 RepID=A0A9P6BXZ5_9AGAR|nr:hypothetical protein P691DRAFT_765687 [Macrolepiota fuliginosa MF-IS2]